MNVRSAPSCAFNTAAGGGVLDNFMFVKDCCWAFQAMSPRTSETKATLILCYA